MGNAHSQNHPDTEQTHCSEKSLLQPLYGQPLPTAPLQGTAGLVSVPSDQLPFLEFSTNGFIVNVLFARLHLLRLIILKSMEAVGGVNDPFLFIAEKFSIIWT